MSSRKYIKRVWRVPKDRGAPYYMAALVCKAMVKHGWPAKVELVPANWGEGFQILHHEAGLDAKDDFWAAASVAARIVARTYGLQDGIDITDRGLVMFHKSYRISPGGFFKEA